MNTIPQHLLHPTFWSALTSVPEILVLACFLAFLSALSFVWFVATALIKKNRECLSPFIVSILCLMSSITPILAVHEVRSWNVLSHDPEEFVELSRTIIKNDCETQAGQLRFALNANPGYLSNAAFLYIQDGVQQCTQKSIMTVIMERKEQENDPLNPDFVYLARFVKKLQDAGENYVD